MKRVLDLAILSIAALPALFVCCGAAIAIRVLDRMPPLFHQQRLGANEEPFTLYKLRTMRPETPDAASHEIGAATVTPLGELLRRYKIDELPQLLNVARGEMTLVGPRPCLPSQTELIDERRSRGVFNARPGITGRAQLAGVDMSQPKVLAAIDADYLATRTFIGDLQVLTRTALGSGRGDPALKGPSAP